MLSISKRKHLALTIKRKIKGGVEPLVEDKRQNAFSKPCSDYSPTNSIGTNCMGKKVKPLHKLFNHKMLASTRLFSQVDSPLQDLFFRHSIVPLSWPPESW